MGQGQVVPAVGEDVTALMRGGGAEPAIGADVTSMVAPNFKTTVNASESNPSLWQSLNTPLVPQIKEAASAIAEWMDRPTLERSRFSAQAHGAVAGAVQGAGDLLSGFTSPVGIALTLAGLGPEGSAAKAIPGLSTILKIPAVQNLQRAVQGLSGGAFAAHGAGEALTAPTLQGKAQGVVEMASGGLGVASGLNGVRVVPPAVSETANPVEQAAVSFGRDRGIPMDAGTVTGSQFVKNTQKRASGMLGSAAPAEAFQRSKDTALTRVGGELADQVHPSAVTAEQAGGALTSSTEDLIRTLAAQADTAYGRLRELEADPANARRVPKNETRAEAREMNKVMAESLGSHAPSPAELAEMRRIRAEMADLPFVKHTFNEVPRGKGGDIEIVPGSAGAPVYDDILASYSGSSAPSRGSIVTSIDQALQGGRFNEIGKATLEVARKRLSGDRGISKPSFPVEAGAKAVARETMLMPVDLRKAKAALEPVYARLKRESELVPVMGEKARGLVALDRLINGPDYAPVSVVDGALSDLKAMARGASMPELRTQGQGLAAQAVSALEQQLQAAVHRSGPDAVTALEQGRTAVKTKAAVADVLEAIKAEPVQAYRQATAPKDSGVAQLRRLQEVAPEVMPQVGRAWLEDVLGRATESGKFEHSDKAYADWQKLGPGTKRIIYGEQAEDLDRFFLLAKRLGENPNPSGTANVLAVNVSQILHYVPAKMLAKVLYTPAGVKLLTKGLTLHLAHPGVVWPAAEANIAAALRVAGVDRMNAAAVAGAGTQDSTNRQEP